VHVRDVAIGHILAAEKRRIGQRYILGNAEGNWTMQQTFAALEEVSGVPAPKMRIPYFAALAVAHVNEVVAGVTGKPPKAPLAGVRMAKYKMWFNPGQSRFATRPAADAAKTGAGGRGGVVSSERVCSRLATPEYGHALGP